MAKSNLDLKGAKGPKLELDFLRLAYASRQLEGEVRCYLVVMTEEIAIHVGGWAIKYEAEDLVEVLVAPLSPEQLTALRAEKLRNIQAMVDGVAGKDASAADASFGRDLGEHYLHQIVAERHPQATQVAATVHPFGVRWDYCGEVG